jgi:hypothetical protein
MIKAAIRCSWIFCYALLSQAQPTISFTFDDGVTQDMPGYTFEEWNSMLLSHLASAQVKPVFSATGFNKLNNKGKSLLQSWNANGHRIANHTFAHPNYNSKEVTFEIFAKDFLKNDSIISQFENYIRLFRFPYLKEGNTKEKVELLRALLKRYNYKNGHVTIDASDWYIDSRLRVEVLKFEVLRSPFGGLKSLYAAGASRGATLG